jgi:neuropeptide S receptor 1
MDKTNKNNAHYLQLIFSFTDLSVGLISVLTDIIWRITIAWNAGNVACKVIRFLQVSLGKNISTTTNYK